MADIHCPHSLSLFFSISSNSFFLFVLFLFQVHLLGVCPYSKNEHSVVGKRPKFDWPVKHFTWFHVWCLEFLCFLKFCVEALKKNLCSCTSGATVCRLTVRLKAAWAVWPTACEKGGTTGNMSRIVEMIKVLNVILKSPQSDKIVFHNAGRGCWLFFELH